MDTIQEIQPSEIWNNDKKANLKEFITEQSRKQSKERLLKNKLLAIQYQMEDYLENDDATKKMLVSDFVKMYLLTFNTTQKRLAELFEMKDSNLHKYLVGDRKLNADLVLKLSSFSHTKPEYWFRVEVKNELFEIRNEKQPKEYEKYDYKNLMVAEP